MLNDRKTYTKYSDARRIVIMLNDTDEDGWVYRIRETPEGIFVIAIYDTDGEFVEYF